MQMNDEVAAELFGTGDILKGIACGKLNPAEMPMTKIWQVSNKVHKIVDGILDTRELDEGVCTKHKFMLDSVKDMKDLDNALSLYTSFRTRKVASMSGCSQFLLKKLRGKLNAAENMDDNEQCEFGVSPFSVDENCPIFNAKMKLATEIVAANSMNIPDYEKEHRCKIAKHNIRAEMHEENYKI